MPPMRPPVDDDADTVKIVIDPQRRVAQGHIVERRTTVVLSCPTCGGEAIGRATTDEGGHPIWAGACRRCHRRVRWTVR